MRKTIKKQQQKAAKRYNKVSLDNLVTAAEHKEKIDISNQDAMKANRITIIKRDGKKEPFNPEKMKKACMWATGNRDFMAEELIQDTEIKLHKEIHIKDMFQQLIVTAVNKISMLNPTWEDVAAKLELMKIYKETYNIAPSQSYPHVKDILAKGVEHKLFNKSTVNKLTDEELDQINAAIVPERDELFNYKGLVTFFDKYCLNYTKTKTLELPQHSYMRVAIALMINEQNHVEKIIEEYNELSLHNYTRATPIMLNALTPGQQLSSCVLNTLDDDSHSILDTGKNLGIYSKFKGGTALDISSMRAKGGYIEGTQGYSSGPVPFMKFYESIMKAWNQGGKRPGALAIYFNWWHLDVMDILSLKSNGGTDENRARGLQYAIKLNERLVEAFIKDEEVTLFDPKDVPELIGKFGKEFNDIYESYANKTTIRKKTISARELWKKIFKERSETGNIYLMHEENTNETSMLNRYIGSSNLCTEIVLPSRASGAISEELITNENGQKQIVKKYTAGEIALCNLSSINAEKWFYMDDEQKWQTVRTLVRGLDNTVDVANYPVKEGKNSNLMYRYLGIGILNQTNYLALKEIIVDTQASAEEQDKLWDDISYMLITASMELATEKGKFPGFYETEWSKGILPIHKANKNAFELTEYEPDWNRWSELAEKVKTFGIRNAQLMAIAPTATSGKAVNAIESTEPVHDFFYKEEGTMTIPTVVPNFRKNNRFYKRAFDCDQIALLKNAAVRQKWIDQSMSVNVYITKPDSLMEMSKLHLYYFHFGGKTMYYLKQQKDGDSYVCESCT
jgi:ribonucleoside-diphosphate reductase alpha chain